MLVPAVTWVHGKLVRDQRTSVLTGHLAAMLPLNCKTVLDVGCGTGRIARGIQDARPDLTIAGVDVLIQPKTAIAVQHFDGKHLPFDNQSMDAVIMVDILHHIDDPMVILREAARVAKLAIIIKDVHADHPFAFSTLAFMDWVGNRGYNVYCPNNFWSLARWKKAWDALGWTPIETQTNLGIYPFWARPFFETNLHFISRLVPDGVKKP